MTTMLFWKAWSRWTSAIPVHHGAELLGGGIKTAIK
jgi:hypothetical protein